MKVKIVRSDLHDFLLFTGRYRLFRQSIGVSAARFYFDKDQVVCVFSHQVDFSMDTAQVLFQDFVAAAG